MNALNSLILRYQRFVLSFLDDESYARKKYKWRFKRVLNLENPQLFSEKIQWLKINDDNQKHSIFADKYAVRKIVAETIGEQYLNDLYFVTEDPNYIRISDLPNSFVLKANHGSGFNYLCADKTKVSEDKIRKTVRKWLTTDYAKRSRENQYAKIERKIICEKYLQDESGSLRDFKILCFSGVPKLIWVDVDRYVGHKRSFYDLDWNPVDAIFNKYPRYEGTIEKPQNLEEMIDAAKALSAGFRFSRIDFYSICGKTIFGEITFHPASGFAEFIPESFSRKVASWIDTSGKAN